MYTPSQLDINSKIAIFLVCYSILFFIEHGTHLKTRFTDLVPLKGNSNFERIEAIEFSSLYYANF